MIMEEGREKGGGKVLSLIEKATNSTAAEVDPRLLKAIKSVVRYSDMELRLAANTLLDLMKRDHSQVCFYFVLSFFFLTNLYYFLFDYFNEFRLLHAQVACRRF